jgi:salicylate hydroxylase
MSGSPFHVIVVGGGIGGLCLAQGLRKAGVSVAVYERDRSRTDRLARQDVRPGGAGALGYGGAEALVGKTGGDVVYARRVP